MLFVVLAAILAARQRLHLTRDLIVAGLRAGVQLVAIGAVLLALFNHAGIPGAAACDGGHRRAGRGPPRRRPAPATTRGNDRGGVPAA